MRHYIYQILSLILLLTPFHPICAQQQAFRMPIGITAQDYQPNTVILRVKPDFRSRCTPTNIDLRTVQTVFSELEGTQLDRIFPTVKQPAVKRKAPSGPELVDLTLIYRLTYQSSTSLPKVINALLELDVFEYAEPEYIYQVSATVNDPLTVDQWHLGKVNAYQAWDIETGDPDVVIAIIDTGTDLDHPDLESKHVKNEDDPVDGIDNDGDGYVDNFIGWNFIEENNDAQATLEEHGVHVSGCAAPATNNGIGVAGVGYSCSLLPVRVGEESAITRGYEGIVYAAEQGADIINCSWGGSFRGQMGQDAINFAVINNDALVVAAAGNSASDLAQYPASYDHVLSVGGTNSEDRKNGFGTFNHSIDISAPGSFIYATRNNGIYGNNSGTSMASPIVAGCAAILRSQDPSWSALQLGEILKQTADDIYSVQDNIQYLNKLGTGRVNLYNALTWGGGPSVVMTKKRVNDNDDGLFESGELLEVTGDFTNHLDAASNVRVEIRSSNTSIIEVVDSEFVIGSMASGFSTDNTQTPFTVRVLPTAEVNLPMSLEFVITGDNGYQASEFIDIVVNVDYINVLENNISTSVNSKGNVGYNDYPQMEGLGFRYKDSETLLYEGGLLLGADFDGRIKVVDRIRGRSTSLEDHDFVPVSLIDEVIDSPKADFEAVGIFADSMGRVDRIGLNVEHRTTAWDIEGHLNYIILEYRITNTSFNTADRFFAGLLMDWDLGEEAFNQSEVDLKRKLAYTYDPNGKQPFTGIQLLSKGPFISHAIDLVEGGSGVSINDEDGFTGDEKFEVLSTSKFRGGFEVEGGNDVINVVSTGSFDLPPGGSVSVVFALLASDDLIGLQATADAAYLRYNGTLPDFGVNQPVEFLPMYPNPATNQTQIAFDLQEAGPVDLRVFSPTGQEVLSLPQEQRARGRHVINANLETLAPGIYYVRLVQGDEERVSPLVIVR